MYVLSHETDLFTDIEPLHKNISLSREEGGRSCSVAFSMLLGTQDCTPILLERKEYREKRPASLPLY